MTEESASVSGEGVNRLTAADFDHSETEIEKYEIAAEGDRAEAVVTDVDQTVAGFVFGSTARYPEEEFLVVRFRLVDSSRQGSHAMSNAGLVIGGVKRIAPMSDLGKFVAKYGPPTVGQKVGVIVKKGWWKIAL